MQNLVISGGNSKYFDYLKEFVKSIRKHDTITKIVICDNSIKGTWNKPGTYKNGGSFTKDQLNFFREYNVEVVIFSELLKKSGISRDMFNKIKTGHWAYPAKYIYCYLIARTMSENIEKIAFFDADMYFQQDIKDLFKNISDDFFYINHENALIGDSDYMKEWIQFSKDRVISEDLDLTNLKDDQIFCTGFFAGKKNVFLRNTNLAFLLSTNQVLPFHNDQPLMNILIHTYGLPFKELGESMVHLAHVDKNNLEFTSERVFLVNGKEPIAVHYHGPHREYVKSKVFKDYKPFNPSVSEKIKHKISKSFRN